MKNNNQSKINFKDICPGPGILKASIQKKDISIKTIAFPCNNWTYSTEELVSINLANHDYDIDGYVFSVVDEAKMIVYSVGYISFDDLLKKSKVVIEEHDAYLTIPLKELQDIKEFTDRLDKKVVKGSTVTSV